MFRTIPLDLVLIFSYTSQLFFEGVQVKVAQGVKESEISYQVAFSKQELRQVIREYPAREVKKGLDHLYKKVDKHLCEEENLLQVRILFFKVLFNLDVLF